MLISITGNDIAIVLLMILIVFVLILIYAVTSKFNRKKNADKKFTIQDSSTCEHKNFFISADIHRLLASEDGPVKDFIADVSIACSDCNYPFEFIDNGNLIKTYKKGPVVSVSGKKISLPIKPFEPKPFYWTKHIVSDINSDGIQRCILCGEEIYNSNGLSYPAGQPAPQGFPPGELYISEDTNPRITTNKEPSHVLDRIIDCHL